MVVSENRVPWQAVCEGAWLPLTLLPSLVAAPNRRIPHSPNHYSDTLPGSKETTILRHNRGDGVRQSRSNGVGGGQFGDKQRETGRRRRPAALITTSVWLSRPEESVSRTDGWTVGHANGRTDGQSETEQDDGRDGSGSQPRRLAVQHAGATTLQASSSASSSGTSN